MQSTSVSPTAGADPMSQRWPPFPSAKRNVLGIVYLPYAAAEAVPQAPPRSPARLTTSGLNTAAPAATMARLNPSASLVADCIIGSTMTAVLPAANAIPLSLVAWDWRQNGRTIIVSVAL